MIFSNIPVKDKYENYRKITKLKMTGDSLKFQQEVKSKIRINEILRSTAKILPEPYGLLLEEARDGERVSSKI